jgi:hypothetical protein
MVSETLERRWLAMDAVEEYLEASKFRFNGSVRKNPPTNSQIDENGGVRSKATELASAAKRGR